MPLLFWLKKKYRPFIYQSLKGSFLTIIFIYALTGIYSLCFQGRVILIKPLLDSQITQKDAMPLIIKLALGVLVLSCLVALFGYLVEYLRQSFVLKVSAKVRMNLFNEILNTNYTFFTNKKMGDLSSGQFQRILVAWSLSSDPQVLLFDEPTTGIDMGGEETIYGLLAKLKKEKDLTILLVTHDLSVVYKFSDYVICLNKCPICQGIPKEVLTPEILRNLYAQEVKFYEHHKH